MTDNPWDGSGSDTAGHDPGAWPQIAPVDFWEERYAGADQVWSGKVNQVLADIASTLVPGRALDLGCGEGADVIWLAQHGSPFVRLYAPITASTLASTSFLNAGR